MKNVFIFLVLCYMGNSCFSQIKSSKADKLRNSGKLGEAIEAYKEDYKNNPKDQKNIYNLACAYALTFQKDSSYRYLFMALKADSTLWPLADTDLHALHDDSRWSKIEEHQLRKFQQAGGKIARRYS